jgi:exonuclease III
MKVLLNKKSQIYPNIVITGDFNTQLTPRDKSSRSKINKETLELKKKCREKVSNTHGQNISLCNYRINIFVKHAETP